uniref:Uncharacterized protein n=1 Tax=Glossina austeni TaxID=7395 RepID=A0A1A9UYU4_GLOAU
MDITKANALAQTSTITTMTTSTNSHLPLDYSLGNFKPAIASDFPGPFVSSTQPALQLRDINVLTTMAATIPSPNQLLQHRVQHQQPQSANDSQQQQQQQQQQQDYQPVSAFRAVLPKKKTTADESEMFIIKLIKISLFEFNLSDSFSQNH